MIYVKSLSIIISDNGLIEGMKTILFLVFQRFFRYPREHVYYYKCKLLERLVKIKYTSSIKRGMALGEMFGFMPYFRSKKNILFKLNDNSKVLDLGGFIGDSAIFFGLQGAKVHCYEPQKKALKLAEENLRLNSLTKVILYPYPVTSKGEHLRLPKNDEFITDEFNLNAFSDSFERIKSISIKEALKKERKWDLVKIDIEGGEWEIIEYFLRKAKEIVKIQGFIIELHKPDENRELMKEFLYFLKKEGFECDLDLNKNLGMLWAKRSSI